MMNRLISRFGATTTAREVVESIDLTGVTAIVTGGSSGIGIETARALALAGANVVIVARRAEQAIAVVASISQELEQIGRGTIRFRLMDLASFASIYRFVKEWKGQPLHLLINNAAVMACPLQRTVDGLEMQLGTNHMGHFLLSSLLLDVLEEGALQRGKVSRVVSLSSIGHRIGGLQWDDMNYERRPYDKWEAYGQAKTANSLFAVGFYERYRGKGLCANAVMPGAIMTPLQRHMSHDELRELGWIDEKGAVSQSFKTAEQGAATSVWAAVAPEFEQVGGFYLEDCGQALAWEEASPWKGVQPHAIDKASAARLWELSLGLLHAFF